MESIYEITLLFDFYGELLTNNQKDVVRMHILEDYSLGEISEILGISRQGVHDSLKRALAALHNYEETLHLVRRFLYIRELAAQAKTANEAERVRLIEKIEAATMEF
ncbi:MAG: YlxM family DNA-binding protein [Clostridiales bacterium]|nr:YlxM family DNA-binding protein [Clostridiales bacterium]